MPSLSHEDISRNNQPTNGPVKSQNSRDKMEEGADVGSRSIIGPVLITSDYVCMKNVAN